LQVVEEDIPEPRAGEVRVKVLVVGISGYDLIDRRYSFPGGPPTPYTPGQDIVGVVDKLGEGVPAVEPGQEVAGFTFGDAGGYAEFICRPASELVPSPRAWILPRPSVLWRTMSLPTRRCIAPPG
jgi:NADPH2:quinone reductase